MRNRKAQQKDLPRTTESSGCKAVDERCMKTRREIPQYYGCKPAVRGLPVLEPGFWKDCWEQAKGMSSIQMKASNHHRWMAFWNHISDIYRHRNRHEAGLVLKIMDLLDSEGLLQKEGVVLDIGCGPGTFTLPLASRVAQVIGIDPAKKMIESLLKEAESKGIRNIVPLCQKWENYDGDPKADLTFAAFTPGVNSAETLMKMNDFSSQYACLVTFSRIDEFKMRDELWREIVGKPYHSQSYHILFPFNYLYSLGLRPHLRFINEGFSYEEPLEHLIVQYESYFRIFCKLDRNKKKKISRYFEDRSDSGKVKVNIVREVCVMWWRTDKK